MGSGSVPITGAPIEVMDDHRLRDLLDAAGRWRTMTGPQRRVVDQVVLVPDVPSFLAALAAWDGRSYYPILIDDPRWTIPFVKAFRPARIVRGPRNRRGGVGAFDEWGAAEAAVGRAWVEDEPGSTDLPPAVSPPRNLGRTPPGIVLSHPGSPALAGAAALAAGRFQPLVRVDPETGGTASKPRPLGFHDRLAEDDAVAFARRIEARVAAVAPSYARLGDEVDFLTLAGDWPYRYEFARGTGLNRGERAVDDLIGRDLGRGDVDLETAVTRWAYTGRLLGDAPSAAYRAMASLFLQPDSALLWNTYGAGAPWTDYDVVGASTILKLIRPNAVVARSGAQSDLASWHEEARRPDGRDLLMLNSSGAPDRFSIAGGPGAPGDVPFAASPIVSMIHSFSAADPSDPGTIAGRFLDRGTFLYYGSMNEPYLIAFRPPYILSQLIVAELPLAAAFRQGAGEPFGRPWRLVYLGDPLYRIDPSPPSDRPERMSSRELALGATLVVDLPGPDPSDSLATLDWCYESTLLALARGGGTPAEVLHALTSLDRDRLDVARRATLDALLIDRSLAGGDVEGLLDRLLRIPGRSRTAAVWSAIETAAFDQVAERLRDDRFGEAVDLWFRIIVGPWPPTSNFPAEITRRLADAADATRLPTFRRRLAEARDRLAAQKILPERGVMLSDMLRKLDRKGKG